MTNNAKDYKNINLLVWSIIDSDIVIQKAMFEGLINTSALARKIAKENNLTDNIDAIISAIRRYDMKGIKKKSSDKIHFLLKNATLSTRTKLVSLLLQKKDETRQKITELYSSIDHTGGEIIRIFEVAKYIKIIIDEKNISKAKKLFSHEITVDINTKLSELSIDYNEDITKIPGLFATIANELSINDISIVDSMICHREHILITSENDLQKTFNIVFSLLKKN
ncbi:MAG: hypothetical protein ACP5N1_03320 [Candidatus Woesearchaeota archaeon]